MKLSIDEQLNIRMEAIGRFQVLKRSLVERMLRMPTVILWDSPAGLENDLAPFRLRIAIDADKKEIANVLRRLLGDRDSFQSRFLNYLPEFKEYLVVLFRGAYADQLNSKERARYLGPDLTISDDAILEHVEEAEAGFGWENGKARQMVWFRVDWDQEHGVDVEFDSSGKILRSWDQAQDQ